nr:hypothetical protein [Sphingobium abikonense]
MLAALPATDAVRQILEEARIHQPFDGAGDFVDMPIGQSEEAGAEMLQMLANCMGVATVPSDSVGRFGKNLVDVAALDSGQHGVQTRALHFADAGAATDFLVGEGVYDGPPFAIGAFAQRGQLIDGRKGIL